MNYLLHAGILVAAGYLCYILTLRRETFFRLNRWMLLGGMAAALLLPLVTVPAGWSLRRVEAAVRTVTAFPIRENPRPEVIGTPLAPEHLSLPRADYGSMPAPVSARGKSVAPALVAPTESPGGSLHWATAVWWIYLAGVSIFLLQLLYQLLSIVAKGRGKRRYSVDGLVVVDLEEASAPFSFWNRVFLHRDGYDAATYGRILEHERVHVRQRHSLDLLLAELLVAVQWFNPFAWLYRRAVENNLEYLTDAEVLRRGEDPVGYQLSLLRVAVPGHAHGLVTSYNQSFLEQRIRMMQRKRSSNRAAWKYLLLPALLLFSLASMNGVAQSAPEPDTAAADRTAIDRMLSRLESDPDFNDPDSREGSIKRSLFDFLREKRANDSVPPPPPPAPQGPPPPPAPPRGSGLTDGRASHRAWTAEVKEDEVCFHFMEGGEGGNHRYSSTRCIDRAEVGDLPGEQIGEFRITRAAGTLTLRGSFADGMGVGTYTFRPAAAFTESLAEAGYRGYEDREIFMFFLSDFTERTIQYAKREFDPSRDELVQMAVFDLNEQMVAEVLADLEAAGYDRPDLETLVQLRVFHIDRRYIQDLAKAGYEDLDLEDVVQAKIHGVSPEFVQEMARLGFRDARFEEIIALAIHNVHAEYAAELAALGYDDLRPDDIVAAKIHRVRPEQVLALRAAGLGDVTLAEAQQAAIHRVDAEYVAELAALGFNELELEDVVAARIHGVDARGAQAMQEAGLRFDGLADLQNFSIHGVTPDLVRGLRELGYTDLDADDFVAARIHGVTPEFVAGYAEFDFGKIPFERLVELRIHHISPEFIRKHRREGDTLEDMIEYGVVKRRSRR